MDQLMPQYVLDTMSNFPGISGLFAAGIFSGSLSTVSGALNSLAAVTIEDYLKVRNVRSRFVVCTPLTRLSLLLAGHQTHKGTGNGGIFVGVLDETAVRRLRTLLLGRRLRRAVLRRRLADIPHSLRYNRRTTFRSIHFGNVFPIGQRNSEFRSDCSSTARRRPPMLQY